MLEVVGQSATLAGIVADAAERKKLKLGKRFGAAIDALSSQSDSLADWLVQQAKEEVQCVGAEEAAALEASGAVPAPTGPQAEEASREARAKYRARLEERRQAPKL